MIRRISTKLVLAVLTAVVLPFVAFAFYINEQMAERLTRHVVQQALMGLAKDLAGQVNYFVEECHKDIQQWAESRESNDAIDEYLVQRRLVQTPLEANGAQSELPVWDAAAHSRWARGEGSPDNLTALDDRVRLTKDFDRYVNLKQVYDVLLLIAADGRLVTSSSIHPEGHLLADAYVAELFATDYSNEGWFQGAMQGRTAAVDHHRSPYRLPDVADPAELAWGYHLGFAAPVPSRQDPSQVAGVLYAVVNWNFIQQLVSNEYVKDAFRGLVEEEPSPYAWIWAEDANTILGHPDRKLYGQTVSTDVGLPQLTQAVLANEEGWGLYPEYTFRDKEKNAAFRRCWPPEQGGFGWVVGVGIDNDDIYATAWELRTLLLGGTAVVLAMAIVWTLFIARRTTGPILELQRTTRRVAEGDLDARIDIRSKDELGALAADFNLMTSKLKEQQDRIVKAEKDAAWREMARQIAHDIKNPLTPISLSLDLLEKARRERPQSSEQILDRTMTLMRRQVRNLQQIAGDFYEFTGGRKPNPVSVEVVALLEEILHLHDAWAVEQGVEVRRDGPAATVQADLGKLRRVFVNLVSNALQAMPDGGTLFVETHVDGEEVGITFRDTGEGIPQEAREHLFEPYFTTKSEGTGLGLAISKQVIEQMHGTIALEPVSDEDGGTIATVKLPLAHEEAGDTA